MAWPGYETMPTVNFSLHESISMEYDYVKIRLYSFCEAPKFLLPQNMITTESLYTWIRENRYQVTRDSHAPSCFRLVGKKVGEIYSEGGFCPHSSGRECDRMSYTPAC